MEVDFLVRLGQRIRRLRTGKGWTQVELAEKVGIDRSFLADVERGKRNISILNLAHHCRRSWRNPLSDVFPPLTEET